MNDTTNLILTAAGALLLSLLGVSWRLLHGKIEDISDGLQKKADIDHLREIETRLQADLRYAKDANEHLIDKLEVRHSKEVDDLSNRLSDRIEKTETNIMAQLSLMLEIVKGK